MKLITLILMIVITTPTWAKDPTFVYPRQHLNVDHGLVRSPNPEWRPGPLYTETNNIIRTLGNDSSTRYAYLPIGYQVTKQDILRYMKDKDFMTEVKECLVRERVYSGNHKDWRNICYQDIGQEVKFAERIKIPTRFGGVVPHTKVRLGKWKDQYTKYKWVHNISTCPHRYTQYTDYHRHGEVVIEDGSVWYVVHSQTKVHDRGKVRQKTTWTTSRYKIYWYPQYPLSYEDTHQAWYQAAAAVLPKEAKNLKVVPPAALQRIQEARSLALEAEGLERVRKRDELVRKRKWAKEDAETAEVLHSMVSSGIVMFGLIIIVAIAVNYDRWRIS